MFKKRSVAVELFDSFIQLFFIVFFHEKSCFPIFHDFRRAAYGKSDGRFSHRHAFRQNKTERFKVGREDGQIRGVIRSSVFLGLTTHYFITTGSGQELEILQTQEGHDILPDGSAVTLTVKAGRINVFRRATEETLIREEGL